MDLDYLQSMMAGEEEAVPIEYQDVWVVGETYGGRLSPLTIAITGKARELANALGAYVKGLLFGPGLESVAEQMIQYGADSVLILGDPALERFSTEGYTTALASHIESGRPEIVLFGATSMGAELAPRLAARFNAPFFNRCMDLGIDEMQRALLATVPRLGGEYYEILVSPSARPQFATVEAGVLPEPFADPYRYGEVESVLGMDVLAPHVEILGPGETPHTDRPLTEARIIVCAGRGLLDEEGFGLAADLAQRLGGQIAGTRGALDEGWIQEERVIGLGGHAVRPRLYLGCGVAGAVEHVAGLEKAGYVVAINHDPDADIFSYADLGVVGDAKEILGALCAALGEK